MTEQELRALIRENPFMSAAYKLGIREGGEHGYHEGYDEGYHDGYTEAEGDVIP